VRRSACVVPGSSIDSLVPMQCTRAACAQFFPRRWLPVHRSCEARQETSLRCRTLADRLANALMYFVIAWFALSVLVFLSSQSLVPTAWRYNWLVRRCPSAPSRTLAAFRLWHDALGVALPALSRDQQGPVRATACLCVSPPHRSWFGSGTASTLGCLLW
jgi:hypothetical protein